MRKLPFEPILLVLGLASLIYFGVKAWIIRVVFLHGKTLFSRPLSISILRGRITKLPLWGNFFIVRPERTLCYLTARPRPPLKKPCATAKALATRGPVSYVASLLFSNTGARIRFLHEQNKNYPQGRIFVFVRPEGNLTSSFGKLRTLSKPSVLNDFLHGKTLFSRPLSISILRGRITKLPLWGNFFIVRPEGIEPSTISLKGSCSTS